MPRLLTSGWLPQEINGPVDAQCVASPPLTLVQK